MQSNEELSSFIMRAQSVFLDTDSERQAFQTLLDDMLSITQCEFGFFSEVKYQDQLPYLKMYSISNISWNKDTNHLYQTMEKEGMEFHDLDNMLGESIRTGSPTISNKFTADSRSRGTPQGHPPIRNYLSMPVFSSDSNTEIIGLIGMANKPDGFSEDYIETLKPLVNLTCILIERNRSRKQQTEYNRALYEAANFDELTKLPNQRKLKEYLGTITRGQPENVENGTHFSLCYLDMDGFKHINDRLGHSYGDQLLIEITRRLRDCISDKDFIARLSGDEFVIIMHGQVERDAYDKIIDVVRKPYEIQQNVVNLTASMGISLYPHHVTDPDHLIRHADYAMYLAKSSGKNQYRLFDGDEFIVKHKQSKFLESFFKTINNNEIKLYLQPKVDLRNNQIEGFEVLCRWQHPTKGLLQPGSFLPQIGGTRASIVLDQFILHQTYELLEELKKIDTDVRLNVNIAAEYFNSPEFEEHLSRLEESFKTVKDITLEIVESAALGDLEEAVARLERCKRLGFKISLDDFGTSFSSLTYFRKLPIDEVKIDRSFTQDLLVDVQDATIIKAIIDMSKGFGRTTVAEGVEEIGQVHKLKALGCEYAQGFLYARPMPVSEAKTYLKKYLGNKTVESSSESVTTQRSTNS